MIIAVGVPLAGLDSTHATAYGPPPLPFTPLDESLAEVVKDAQARLEEDATGVGSADRESASNGWFAQISGNATEDALTAIEPQNRRVAWSEDLSGHETVTAGMPYLPDGTPVADPTPAPGSILWETTYEAGEFPAPFRGVPADDPTMLAPLLTGDAGGPADAINGITALLNAWTVPNATHAAFLDLITGAGEMTVEGTTTDRAGRPAIGLRATSDTTPWFDVIVLMSADSGRIIGVEEIYTGFKDQLAIPPGTVTSYTIWETTP
ncbi:hypothetical protein ACEYYH_02235 [Microbacterium trichothecenolyticum]|uniref:hypothetical protein n=1 Tax=Microbacterium trichothecenolyticum TaxID=69370 RepID=UPI0035BE2289